MKKKFALILSFIMLISVMPEINFLIGFAAGENLFINGGFEESPNIGWGSRHQASFERTTDNPHSGKYALKHLYDMPTESIVQDLRLVPGETYDFSMWGRLDAGKGECEVNCMFAYGYAANTFNYSKDSHIAAVNGKIGEKWTEIKGTFTYTGYDNKGRKVDDNVQFIVKGSRRSGDKLNLYFDDFSLIPQGKTNAKSERLPETFKWADDPLPKAKEVKTKKFTDVENHWAKTTVEALGSEGIINGVSETSYAPELDVTRAEFLTLITNTFGVKRKNQQTAVCDINPNDWYYEAIATAENIGLIPDKLIDNGNIHPNSKLKRGEAASILANYAHIFDAQVKNIAAEFTDNHTFGIYASDINNAFEYGLINGYEDGMFKPEKTIKRSEAAELIKNAVELRGRRYFYVDAASGNDENIGTLSKPFKTVEAARDAVRENNKDMTGNIYVFIKGGEYYQKKTLKMTQADSGTNGFNIIYTSYGDGQATLTGGQSKVLDWQIYDENKNIYRAQVGSANTRNMFVDGVRAVRARSAGKLEGYKFDKNQEYQLITTSMWVADLTNNGDIEISHNGTYYCNWRPYVQDIKADGKYVHIKLYDDYLNYYRDSNAFYALNLWIENAYELIDEEGEWYWNRSDGYLYYKPRQWEDLKTAKITLPDNDKIIDAVGDITDSKYEPVHNVIFDNVGFAYTTAFSRFEKTHGIGLSQNSIIMRRLVNGTPSGQNENLPAAVNIDNMSYINFTNCEFKNIGTNALNLFGGIQHSNITANHFYDISGNAVQVGENFAAEIKTAELEQESTPFDKRYYKADISIDNNYMHDTAVEFLSSGALAVTNLQYSTIKNNEVFRTSYSGMHLGYGFAERAFNLYAKTDVTHNYIHKTNMIEFGLDDGGAIYHMSTTYGDVRDILTDKGRNKISYNYAEDLGCSVNSIYSDEGCSWLEISHNVFNTDREYWPYGIFTTGNQSKANIATENYLVGNDPINVLGTKIPSYTEWYAETHGDTSDKMFDAYPQMNTKVGPMYKLEKDMSTWDEGALDIVENAGITNEYIEKFPEEFQDFKIVQNDYGRIFDEKSSLPQFEPAVYNMDIGQTREVKLEVSNRKGTAGYISPDRVYISNQSPDVVEVLQNNSIKALKNGVANLTVQVRCGANRDVVRTYPLNVYVGEEIKDLAGTDMKVFYNNGTAGEWKCLIGDPQKMDITYKTTNERILKPIEYTVKSLNEDIAYVNEDGELVGVKSGTGELLIDVVWGEQGKHEQFKHKFRSITNEMYEDYDSSQIVEMDDDFFNLSNWKFFNTSKINVNNQLDDGIQLSSGGVVFYNKEMFNDKIMHFKMKVNHYQGWPSFALSCGDTDTDLNNEYVLTFYEGQYELQRFNNGQRTVLWGIGNAFDGTVPIYGGRIAGKFKWGDEYDVGIGTFDVSQGVRIVLYIDGLKVMDIIDYKNKPDLGISNQQVLTGGGYFGIHSTSSGGQYIELRKADKKEN